MSQKDLPLKAGLKTRTIQVDYLARVEGEGALTVKMHQGKVTEVALKIFEPPRFFEAFLQGRTLEEVPDITARICGICPVAYQMSSVHALESALDGVISARTRALRRVLYCGEWIESHTLHAVMLHGPDFLGYADVIEMAKKFPEVLQWALKVKRAGNRIVSTVGGREIHPINVKVGGFYTEPSAEACRQLMRELEEALPMAEKLVRWAAQLPYPQFERQYDLVCLSHPTEYPMNEGVLRCGSEILGEVSRYEEFFEEYQVPHSNALQSLRKGHGEYLVGPLARFNLEFAKLSESTKRLAQEVGVLPPIYNPYRTVVIRLLETFYALGEALRWLQALERGEVVGDMQGTFGVGVTQGPRMGMAATEAPRGLLYHRYEVRADRTIQFAKIVPPTSQNQKTIESDVREVVLGNPSLSDADLTWRCEQTIRNYDPCISCATHFLKLQREEVGSDGKSSR